MEDPQRVFVLGDVHGDREWFNLMCQEARNQECSVILQVGDFGFWPHKSWGIGFLNQAARACNENNIECWWIDGNHENHEVLEHVERDENGMWRNSPLVHLARGTRWQWQGVKFLACGGAYSIDKQYRTRYESWWPQETITEADVIKCWDGGNVDVLVTHDAPWFAKHVIGAGTAGNKDSWPESAANRQRVQAILDGVDPKLLIHGHYHHRNSTRVDNTRVEGLGRDWQGKDAYVILDLPELSIS